MKKWIITLYLSIIIGVAFAADSVKKDSGNKDKLIERLNSTKIDTSRLRILYELTLETKSVPKERISYTDQLLSEAQKCNNSEYICLAYLSYMYVAYNEYDADEVFKWMELLEPLARKEKLYDQLFSGKQCVLDMLLIGGQYELQEKEALKMLAEATRLDNTIGKIAAYQSLAYGYQFTYRPDKAIESLESAYLLIDQCQDDLLNLQTISTLISMLDREKDVVKWPKYLKAQEDYYENMIKREPKYASMLKADIMQLHLSYLNYYLYIKDDRNATIASKMAGEYYSPMYAPTYKLAFHLTQCNYYKRMSMFSEALNEINQALVLTDAKIDISYYNILADKAEILYTLDRSAEAVKILKFVSESKDSLQSGILNKQIQQIKSNYNADTLLLEKETIQKRALMALLIPLCLVFIVLVFFVIRIRKVGAKLRTAKEEMGKMADIVNQTNIAKEKFLSNIGTAIHKPLDLIVKDSLRLSSDEQIEKNEREVLSKGIKETSSRLLDMINNILMLSKLEAGMMKYNEGKMDVYAFIRNMAQIKAFNNKIPITTTFPDDVEMNVTIDINLFTQLFDSLFASIARGCDQIVIEQEQVDDKLLHLVIRGSGLAEIDKSQQSVIQNEINRMLIEHFGGTYIVCTDSDNPQIKMSLARC